MNCRARTEMVVDGYIKLKAFELFKRRVHDEHSIKMAHDKLWGSADGIADWGHEDELVSCIHEASQKGRR